MQQLLNRCRQKCHARDRTHRFVETAFSVLNAPEHRDGHPEMLIATLEMKAQRQTKKDSIASLRRALSGGET